MSLPFVIVRAGHDDIPLFASWESIGGKAATHSVWLNVVT
jgi:hypothetical protein